MNIDYKGAKVTWDWLKPIDWSKEVSWSTLPQGLGEGWYGGKNGHFSIYVIIPNESPDEHGCYYTSESWHYPYMRVPCKNSSDMLTQLQRAIDIYPELCKH